MLREVVPVASPADDLTIDMAAMVMAQSERAMLVLGAIQSRELERVRAGESPVTARWRASID